MKAMGGVVAEEEEHKSVELLQSRNPEMVI